MKHVRELNAHHLREYSNRNGTTNKQNQAQAFSETHHQTAFKYPKNKKRNKILIRQFFYKKNKDRTIEVSILSNKSQLQTLQVLHAGDLTRDFPGQIIHIQIQINKLSQVSNLSWYLSIQRVIMQVESSQVL